MKIGFLHGKENDMTLQIGNQLRDSLSPHDLLSWPEGEVAPCEDLEVLLVSGAVTIEQLESQPKLGLIQTTSTGYETVDLAAATRLGIWVSYAPSDLTGNATSVAEFAVLLLLGASRQLGRVIDSDGRGSAAPRLHSALNGKTACIVGLGSIGLQVADRLRPFGVLLLATDEHPEHAPAGVTAFAADKLLVAVADADFVIICVRASAENQNLISASVIAGMKRGAVLVNVARGMLVDEDALCAALESGHIAAVGLDVVRHEPLEAANRLLMFPQALLTPHMAALTDITVSGTAAFIKQVIAEYEASVLFPSLLNSPDHPRKTLTERPT